MSKITKLKVLELYSGVGGMHLALNESEIPFEVVAAADINTVTNEIYRYNFPDVKIITKTIECVTIKDLNKLGADMVVMSPPCQPFTRVGLQRDHQDGRTKSFLHFLDLLSQLDKPPDYMLVENVKGFDKSETRDRLLTVLQHNNYILQEFLLSPLQFGVPNSRLRYYLLAKRTPLKFHWDTTKEILEEIPDVAKSFLKYRLPSGENHKNCCTAAHLLQVSHSCHGNKEAGEQLAADTCSNHGDSLQTEQLRKTADCSTVANEKIHSNQGDGLVAMSPSNNDQTVTGNVTNDNRNVKSDCDTDTALRNDREPVKDERPLHLKYQSLCRPITDYLEDKPVEYFNQFMVPEKLFKRFWVMDIVQPTDTKTICFTKGYAHHMEGTGSVLQTNQNPAASLTSFKPGRVYNDEVHEAVRNLKLRYFTPREIARIMCFPDSFNLPDHLTVRQCYRVLGNSLNVHVVSILLRLLTLGDLS